MNKHIAVEDCRFLLSSLGKLLTDESAVKSLVATREALGSFSMRECFDFAKHLLVELEEHVKWYNQKHATPAIGLIKYPPVSVEDQDAVDALICSFELCNDITREEYIWILDKAGLSIIDILIQNKTFPIDLLIDNNLLQRHTSKPEYLFVRAGVDYVISCRVPEIVHHFRGIVPDSEHMSDEMVLSVAGITI